MRTPGLGTCCRATRDSILAIAKHDGRVVEEGPIRPDELFEATEIFLTATSVGVWPVLSIDDRPIGSGRLGPVSLLLKERFEDVVSGRVADFVPWLTFVDEAR